MANLTPWEPQLSLREAMNRLFEESFLRPGLLSGEETGGVLVPVDVYETDEAVVLKAAVPGMKPEDIEVTITGDVLSIKGEYKEEKDQKRKGYLRQERRYGSFCRQLSLPASVDSSKINADFENGVLTLNMPKLAEVKPKTIKITTR